MKDVDMIDEPLETEDGFLNPVAMKKIENAIFNTFKIYERCKNEEEWNKKHWIFVKDITSFLAKWAVSQSPYNYPEGLETVIKYLDACLSRKADKNKMMNVSLCEIGKMLYDILYEQGVECFDKWNEPKNENKSKIQFVDRYSNPNPDDDFIDLDALLQNVCISLRNKFRYNEEFNKKLEEKIWKIIKQGNIS